MIRTSLASFDRGTLSKRESEILDLAIEGFTDVQIAQRLEISQSTVNSYWVRIRGKLGQLSRVELVALSLKQKARDDMAKVMARNEEFERRAHEHSRLSEDFPKGESYHAALDAMPEALLFCCEKGLIRYTNDRLDAMFGYAKDELIGEELQVLFPLRRRERERQAMSAHLENPVPKTIGINDVAYGMCRDGREFRLVMLVDSRPTSSGLITTCLVRDFMNEIDIRRRMNSAPSEPYAGGITPKA